MFQVRLFGYFRMTKDNQIINESSMRSPQLTRLLVYLIIYRDRAVTNQELEQYLWNGAGKDHQKEALKNLVYRLRKELCKTFGPDDYILNGRGSYQWNPEYTIKVDSEEFQKEYDEYMTLVAEMEQQEEGQKESLQKEANRHCEAAIELYQGIFLNSFEADYWANLGLQYQSMYIKLVNTLREELWKAEDFDELEKLCSKVLNTDPYDEDWNRCMVRTLLAQNKTSQAEKYYRSLEKNIQNIRGMQKTNLLRVVKQELKGKGISDAQITQTEFAKQMEAGKKLDGAFRCDYREFKALCLLQGRKDKRHKENSYTLLITLLTDETTIGAATEVKDFIINMAMEELEEALLHNLRDCDVLCKASSSQFYVLLDRCTYENSLRVARRVFELYETKNASKMTKLHLDVEKITIL